MTNKIKLKIPKKNPENVIAFALIPTLIKMKANFSRGDFKNLLISLSIIINKYYLGKTNNCLGKIKSGFFIASLFNFKISKYLSPPPSL